MLYVVAWYIRGTPSAGLAVYLCRPNRTRQHTTVPPLALAFPLPTPPQHMHTRTPSSHAQVLATGTGMGGPGGGGGLGGELEGGRDNAQCWLVLVVLVLVVAVLGWLLLGGGVMREPLAGHSWTAVVLETLRPSGANLKWFEIKLTYTANANQKETKKKKKRAILQLFFLLVKVRVAIVL